MTLDNNTSHIINTSKMYTLSWTNDRDDSNGTPAPKPIVGCSKAVNKAMNSADNGLKNRELEFLGINRQSKANHAQPSSNCPSSIGFVPGPVRRTPSPDISNAPQNTSSLSPDLDLAARIADMRARVSRRSYADLDVRFKGSK